MTFTTHASQKQVHQLVCVGIKTVQADYQADNSVIQFLYLLGDWLCIEGEHGDGGPILGVSWQPVLKYPTEKNSGKAFEGYVLFLPSTHTDLKRVAPGSKLQISKGRTRAACGGIGTACWQRFSRLQTWGNLETESDLVFAHFTPCKKCLLLLQTWVRKLQV